MRTSALPVCLWISVLAAPALAQEAGVEPPAAEATAAPTPAAGVETDADLPELDVDQPYPDLVQDALRRLVQRDAAGAERLLRAAIDVEPSRPEAYCHLGDAQRQAGELEEAVLSYQSCTRFAVGADNPRYQRIARSNEALTLERMEGRLEQARAAYEALASSEDPAESEAWTLASERLKVLAAAGLLETVYAPIRLRIAEREEKQAKRK